MSENVVSVPGFQSMMLPFLECLESDEVKHLQDIVEELVGKMNITEEQRNLRYASRGKKFSGNARYVATYLIKANLISRPDIARFQITEDGKALLRQNLDNLSVRIFCSRSRLSHILP